PSAADSISSVDTDAEEDLTALVRRTWRERARLDLDAYYLEQNRGTSSLLEERGGSPRTTSVLEVANE
ncbi:unnamed protein product, partial [Amoebophrya sp. A25]